MATRSDSELGSSPHWRQLAEIAEPIVKETRLEFAEHILHAPALP